jgi:hypothetical protein
MFASTAEPSGSVEAEELVGKRARNQEKTIINSSEVISLRLAWKYSSITL